MMIHGRNTALTHCTGMAAFRVGLFILGQSLILECSPVEIRGLGHNIGLRDADGGWPDLFVSSAYYCFTFVWISSAGTDYRGSSHNFVNDCHRRGHNSYLSLY